VSSIDEQIARVNDAINRRDFDRVSALLDPDAVWEHNIGMGTPEEGVYRGRESVLALLERIVDTWEYLRAEPREVTDLGHDRYLVRGDLHSKHQTTETEFVTPYVQALVFRDGLLQKGRMNAGGESGNVALVRRFVEAFNHGDLEAMLAGVDPEVELHEWPTAPGAQSFAGPEGARQALEGWFEIWEWMRIQIEDLVDLGDKVLVTLHQQAKGKESAVEVEIRSFNVYTFRDGKIVRLQLFTEREPALEAAGLTANNEEEK
jgi:ketosteroid isomerase-like protein